MRMRIMILLVPLAFTLVTCRGPASKGVGGGIGGEDLAPLATQAAADWPPRAVRDPEEGEVPDFSAKNETCMDCHSAILKVETGRADLPNLHRRHLESRKTAYQGRNRDCLTCHEMISEVADKKREGGFIEGGVFHPNSNSAPGGVWKKLIVRSGPPSEPELLEFVRPANPYTYKPTLKRLVCLDCHGPDSRIKTFYGIPEK